MRRTRRLCVRKQINQNTDYSEQTRNVPHYSHTCEQHKARTMSYHSTIEGVITYSTADDRDTVFQTLTDNGWNTAKHSADEPPIAISTITAIDYSEDEYVIVIPRTDYWNLGKHIDMMIEDAANWDIIESTGDGELYGYVYTPNETQTHELTDWITAHNEALSEREPEKDAFETHSDWFDAHSSWQLDVEYCFLNHMKDKTNLTIDKYCE